MQEITYETIKEANRVCKDCKAVYVTGYDQFCSVCDQGMLDGFRSQECLEAIINPQG